jgi:hypothetical protein
VLALTLASPAASAAVTASLSATDIAPGDTVQLTLQHDGRGGGEPDLSPLRQDFDVLGTSRSTQIQIMNGSASASTSVEVTLSPKHAGRLTVPSITWGNERSPALALDVSGSPGNAAGPAAGNGAAAGNAREFIETQVDTTQPYVQAAVQLTVRLYTSQTLYHPDLSLNPGGDVVVQQVGMDERSSTVRNGETYQVITRHYVLFAQHSGVLKLAGPVLDAQVAAGGNGNGPFGADPFAQLFGSAPFGTVMTRPIRLHGDAIVLNVRPRPADANASYWLPATQMTLTSQWSPAPLQARAGDPVTVKLHLQATGLTAAQLPDLTTLWRLPAGLRAYPDQATLHDAAAGDAVVGSRDQTIALIADQPGHFTIPALAVQWWDTATNAPHEATVPARTLVILPAAAAPAGTAAAPQVAAPAPAAAPSASAPVSPGGAAAATQGPPWRWIAAGLAALWLLTLGAWAWSARRGDARPGKRGSRPATHASGAGTGAARTANASQARTACAQACRRADAPAARRELLAWAANQWPATPPAGLSALARLLDDPDAAALLRELDRACYAGGPWHGEALAAHLAGLRVPDAARTARHQPALAPLYPS